MDFYNRNQFILNFMMYWLKILFYEINKNRSSNFGFVIVILAHVYQYGHNCHSLFVMKEYKNEQLAWTPVCGESYFCLKEKGLKNLHLNSTLKWQTIFNLLWNTVIYEFVCFSLFATVACLLLLNDYYSNVACLIMI